MVKRLRRHPALEGAFALLFAVAAASAQQPIELQEVMRLAAQRAAWHDANLEVARAESALAERLHKRRPLLHVNAVALAFSNPALAAVRAGLGFSYSSFGALTRAARETLLLNVVEAHIEAHRARLRTEVEAANAFFSLLEEQRNYEIACLSADEAEARSRRVRALAAAGEATAIDEARAEQNWLLQQSGCLDAEARRRGASERLAFLTSTQPAAEYRAVESLRLASVLSEPLPEAPELLQIALDHRREAALLRDRRAVLGKALRSFSAWLPDDLSAEAGGLNWFQDEIDSRPANLIGGGLTELRLGWRIPLVKTNRREAEAAALRARARRVWALQQSFESEIRYEIGAARIRWDAARRSIDLARRQEELALRQTGMIAARVSAGLEPLEAEESARASALRARQARGEVEQGLSAAAFQILALCGVHEASPEEQIGILRAYQPGSEIGEDDGERNDAISQTLVDLDSAGNHLGRDHVLGAVGQN